MEDKNSIPESAKRLRALLKDTNITQKQLAEIIHVDPRYISMICCGDRGLSTDMAERIIKVFPDTRIQWLLGLDDYQTENDLTQTVLDFHSSIDSLAEDLIKSHGYRITHYRDSESHDMTTITSPVGISKTIPRLLFQHLIDSINDYVEGQLLLGLNKDKNSYTGMCF